MQIDRLIYPISSLGPGERLVIWTVGCSLKCRNCSNPELWRENPDKEIDVYTLVDMIKQAVGNRKIDGITITGGDPIEQFEELVLLLSLLAEITDDVLLYTGRRLEDINNVLGKTEFDALFRLASVLIDGKYVDELNHIDCPLRGSSNQNIIYFDESLKEKYSDYLKKGRTIQNVFYGDKMISVGIHNTGL